MIEIYQKAHLSQILIQFLSSLDNLLYYLCVIFQNDVNNFEIQHTHYNFVVIGSLLLKGPYADDILFPKGATRSTFLISNENPYFSHSNPKIPASNSLYFGSYSRKCAYFRYTNFFFLCISFPVSHTFFASGEKIKSKFEVKLCKMCLRGQGQSV